jgi:peptidyl-prolyl cis-trans isomerase SurA
MNKVKRKILLLTFILSSHSIIFSQALFTYGNNAISKEEFLKAYNKNVIPAADKEKSLKEYLDLYINFKLKVADAKRVQLDTLPQLQYDVEVFKNQIIENYLNNEGDVNALIDEAFARSQKDIHVVYFSIPTDSAFLSGQVSGQVYNALQKGKNNYEELAKEISAKNNYKVKVADVGYISAFSIPYEYESIVYGLAPGQISAPYKSKNNFHIFKMLDERKAMGRWKIAQILLAVPPGEQATNFKSLQTKADSVYQLLKNGADFGQLAKEFSNDQLTYLNNGEIPEFGCGKYDLSFEKEVIQLKNDGDVSMPFATSHGFHIIKRISQTPIADKSDGVFMAELKQKVLQDTRINKAKDKFIKNVIAQIGFKKNPAVKDAELFANADSVSANRNFEKTNKSPIGNKTIFSFTKANIKGSSWLKFINKYKNIPQQYQGENNSELLQKFISIQAIEYYKQHLEEYNPQFAYQMKEFKEGNMLFEMMERNIWKKAASDSLGLQKYYAANKNKYLWAASADAIIFNCPDNKTAKKIADIIANDKDWRKRLEQDNTNIQTDSGRYELSQLPIENLQSISAGAVSAPVVNTTDNTVSFVKILKIYPANQQRSFEDAKGLLINDFQNKIEEQWIASLKKRYPVKINTPVFQSLLKE